MLRSRDVLSRVGVGELLVLKEVLVFPSAGVLGEILLIFDRVLDVLRVHDFFFHRIVDCGVSWVVGRLLERVFKDVELGLALDIIFWLTAS